MASPRKATPRKAVQKAEPSRAISPFEAMDRMFDSYFGRSWPSPFRIDWPTWAQDVQPFEGQTPRVDIIERDKEVVVKAELPGVDKKDIDVSVANNTVTIKATTSHEEKEEKGDYYRCEMSRGSYARTVALPAEVAEARTKARFKDGVLEIKLPKTSAKDSKQHKVKIT